MLRHAASTWQQVDSVSARSSFPKALQIPRHLGAQWKVLRIEPFYLVHAGPRVFGEIKNVDLAVAQDQSHANGGVT